MYFIHRQCLKVYGFIRNFTEILINEILRVKSAGLRIFKHPAPPLFMHVHNIVYSHGNTEKLEKYGIH